MVRQLTVQEKKIKELRSIGLSLREIAERLRISRVDVEKGMIAQGELIPEEKIVPTSKKKATFFHRKPKEGK